MCYNIANGDYMINEMSDKYEMHFVLGKGNLGMAIKEYYTNKGVPVKFAGRKDIDIKVTIRYINIMKEGRYKIVVWNTEGHGSIPECEKEPIKAFDTHVMRNLHLANDLHKDILLINFSTNYATPHSLIYNKSVYAASKAGMENITVNHPREKITTFRVANLYSKYFPMKSFQGKILKNADRITSLPWNVMIPTDCDWLIKTIDENLFCPLDNIDRYHKRVLEMAPKGNVSAKRFGEMLLNKELEDFEDKTRPVNPELGSTWDLEWDDNNWETVWENAKPAFMEAYNKENSGV